MAIHLAEGRNWSIMDRSVVYFGSEFLGGNDKLIRNNH